jgi:hypothetical protein
VVTVYLRPGCHLCDEVEQVVADVARRRRFKLEHKNILDDISTYDEFKLIIPVVHVNGVEVARFRLTAYELEAALTD